MRQTFFTFVVITSLLAVAPAYAQEASASPATPGISQVRREIQVREELKEKREDQKAIIKTTRSQFNLVRASVRVILLERKYGFVGKRFDNIIARFDSRIKTLESAGKDLDLTAVKSALSNAKSKLIEAKANGNIAVEGFKSITETSTKEDFTKLRVLVKTADASFRSVNDALKLALKELKTISKPALPAASAAVGNSI